MERSARVVRTVKCVLQPRSVSVVEQRSLFPFRYLAHAFSTTSADEHAPPDPKVRTDRQQPTKMALDPDDAPPGWTDAIRRVSSSISSTTIQLNPDAVAHHHIGGTEEVKPSGQGLIPASRKLPKLRSARDTTSQQEEGAGKLTTSALEKLFETRRQASVAATELAQTFNIEPAVLETILRYHNDLPDYKVKLRDLATLAK